MNEQYGFWVETSRCTKCWACEVACKAWKGIDAGTVSLRRVLDIWSGTFPDVSRTFLSMACMHCGDPACEAVCPTGAISKQEDTGIVVQDPDKCIGCHYCFFACPFGNPQYSEDGTMMKCDFCLDRLEAGKEPACVATCPTGALHAGTMDELAKHVGETAAKKLMGATNPAMLVTP